MNLKNIKTQRNIAIIIAIVAIFLVHRCSKNDSIVDTLNQNLIALNDSIRSYKDKNSDLVYEKYALISDARNLKYHNIELANEIKYLKDNPIVVVKTNVQLVDNPVEVPIYIESGNWNSDNSLLTRELDWHLDTTYSDGNYRKLSGKFMASVDTNLNLFTSPMHITNSELGLSLTTGLTEKDELLEIFVKSKYPGFKPTKIDGALIDPKKSEVLKRYFPPKKWSIGPYGGYGLYLDPSNMKIGNGIQLGIGIQYHILQWNFKKK